MQMGAASGSYYPGSVPGAAPAGVPGSLPTSVVTAPIERPPSENGMLQSHLHQQRREDNRSTTASSAGGSLLSNLEGITTESISRSTSPAMAGKLGPSSYTYPGFRDGGAVNPTGGNGLQSTPPPRGTSAASNSSNMGNAHGGRFAPQEWDAVQQNMGVVQAYDLVSASGAHVPRVTTTMWEDEATLCYQVKANGVSVVRRADNDMVNGTKLLNVTKMTRGKRDGILKAEKVRHVVKIGSMHLKGVWIPFERALLMAEREKIVDALYPLFVRDIEGVLGHGGNSSAVSAGTAPTPVAHSVGSITTSVAPTPLPLAPTPVRSAGYASIPSHTVSQPIAHQTVHPTGYTPVSSAGLPVGLPSGYSLTPTGMPSTGHPTIHSAGGSVNSVSNTNSAPNAGALPQLQMPLPLPLSVSLQLPPLGRTAPLGRGSPPLGQAPAHVFSPHGNVGQLAVGIRQPGGPAASIPSRGPTPVPSSSAGSNPALGSGAPSQPSSGLSGP